MTVDNGDNWYENCLNANEWFNISLPVGPFEQKNLISEYYRGSKDVLLFVYHPNIWSISKRFENVNCSKLNTINDLGWKKNLFSAFRIRAKQIVSRNYSSKKIFWMSETFNGLSYRLNARYFILTQIRILIL